VVPRPVTLLGNAQETPLERDDRQALPFLIVEIIKRFEWITRPLRRNEGARCVQ
jgi:hypothetical protein